MNDWGRIGDWILVRQLGRGEAGTTWLARHAEKIASPGDADAVLKILDIGDARNWTGFDLFEREVGALRSLSHPGIPRFLESFEDEEGGESRLVLVMELMPGLDLATVVAQGRRFTEAEVESILAGLADILAYLGSLRPPVVHRDVNPRNILLGDEGKISLVDFSGARDVLIRSSLPGATVIGTAGYIPLEQISGRATIRSDRYGAAATALFLLTRANPTELPLRDLKPDLGSLPWLGPRLVAMLDSWLEPDEARRSLEPKAAARMLRGEEALPDWRGLDASPADYASDVGEAARLAIDEATASLPRDSRVRISEEGRSLKIVVPAAGFSNIAALGIGGFSLFWLAFVAFWTFSAIAMGAPIFFVLFSLPFWGVGVVMLRATLLSLLSRTELLLDEAAGLCLSEGILGVVKKSVWPLSDLGKSSIEDALLSAKGAGQKELVIEAGVKKLRIGRNLSARELFALRRRIEIWRQERLTLHPPE